MHKGKIDNFNRFYKGEREFPWFRELSEEDCLNLRLTLKEAWKLNAPVEDGVKLTLELKGLINRTNGFNAEENDFCLGQYLKIQQVETSNKVYLDWRNIDEVDLMCLEDLVSYFDDIWYPAADDLTLFDNTFK
jgi:hypothetical protein